MLSEGAAVGLRQQIGQGDAVQIVVDDGVQLFPHGERGAVTGAGAGVFVALQAGDGGQRALGQPQDLAHGIVGSGGSRRPCHEGRPPGRPWTARR